MFAALERHPAAIKLLLASGADVNARNNLKSTALILAAQMGDPATVKLLLEKGAEVEVRDEWGYTALLYAARLRTMILLCSIPCSPMGLDQCQS